MSRLISPIYSRGPDERSPAQRAENQRKAMSALWHKLGMVALNPKDITDEWIRQAVINEAIKQYGERK